MHFSRIKRTLTIALMGTTLTAGAMTAVVISAQPAHADDWTTTAGWQAPMTHSSATCATGAILVAMPSNEAYGVVRTITLQRWNGYQFANVNASASATSNGAYYFEYFPYWGWYLMSSLTVNAPTHGYYRAYATVTYNGRILSQGQFQTYAYGPATSPDISYCTI